MVQNYKYYFISLLIFSAVQNNNALISSLKEPVNKVDVDEGNVEEETNPVKAVLDVLPVEKFPRFTKQELPQSAVDLVHAGNENEDKDLNITQLIKKNGFPVEKHEAVTADGYILGMFRIPNDDGYPILLIHGLLSSSDDWTTNGRFSSLPYLLADKGYDVWLGNARGNQHSRKHVRFDPKKDKKQFWDFSWDEIGRYDLPAMIDYILDTTGHEKLIYIGHSQGCTCFYVLCSEIPEYNKKILLMIALAPPVFMAHTPSPALQALAPFGYYEDAPLVKAVGPRIFADDLAEAVKRILCDDATDVVTQLVCTGATFLVFGFNYEQANYERLPTILKHACAGSSTKQFSHFAQSIVHGNFSLFDYGHMKNKRIYGCKTPPEYPLQNIEVPIAIFHGNNDWAVSIKGVKELLSHLKRSKHTFYRVPDNNFAHTDFLWAKDVKTLLYDDIICMIEEKLS